MEFTANLKRLLSLSTSNIIISLMKIENSWILPEKLSVFSPQFPTAMLILIYCSNRNGFSALKYSTHSLLLKLANAAAVQLL